MPRAHGEIIQNNAKAFANVSELLRVEATIARVGFRRLMTGTRTES
jgi:hypothetical protein